MSERCERISHEQLSVLSGCVIAPPAPPARKLVCYLLLTETVQICSGKSRCRYKRTKPSPPATFCRWRPSSSTPLRRWVSCAYACAPSTAFEFIRLETSWKTSPQSSVLSSQDPGVSTIGMFPRYPPFSSRRNWIPFANRLWS